MSERPTTEPRTEAEKALDRLDEIAPTLWQQQPKGHPMMPMQIIIREWVATVRSALAEAAQGAAPRAEGRAVQDDELDVERLALWIHYTRHGNRDPDFIMDEARSRAARIIEGLRAASPLNASGDAPALQATGEPPHPLDVPHDSGQMRETLWRHHGHSEGLYGDDGERQCNHYPPVDFRRDHIDALLAHMRWSVEHEALGSWRAGATGEGEPPA